MGAKTCQLCGKPLSKIWIGAGEFCSREHRNQYRMRRGLDRLLEANQVANVIRRREVPKPITSLHPPAEDAHRLAESGAQIGKRDAEPSIPSVRWKPRVTMPPARGPLGQNPHRLHLERRDFGILRETGLRVVPRFRPPVIEPPGAAYLSRARRPKPMMGAPRPGAMLKVSATAGFRLPALKKDSLRVPAPRRAALIYPRKPFLTRVDERDRAAGSRPFRISLAPRIKAAVPSTPLDLDRALVPPGLVREPQQPANGYSLVPRAWSELRRSHDGAQLRPVPYQEPGRAQSGFVAVPRRQILGMDDPRLALVPLSPQDGQFRYSPVISVAVERAPMAAGTGSGAGSGSAAAAPVRFEEHFDSGMGSWLGSTADWRLDVAGARTGALALFQPSLALKDYELEFLTRIDQRSVTWVFRAAGFDDYYSATLTALAGGEFEFARREVVDSEALPPATVVTKPGVGPRAAFTVKMRAVGNQFSVWVDGRLVESWTDDLLPTGGIGFIGAPDDRARLYWVRISRIGEAGKE